MGNCYNYTPIPPAEASCIIAHLFVELALPCSCCIKLPLVPQLTT